jgi:hypothetical protein
MLVISATEYFAFLNIFEVFDFSNKKREPIISIVIATTAKLYFSV